MFRVFVSLRLCAFVSLSCLLSYVRERYVGVDYIVERHILLAGGEEEKKREEGPTDDRERSQRETDQQQAGLDSCFLLLPPFTPLFTPFHTMQINSELKR